MKIGLDIRTVGKKRTGDETVTLQLVNNLLKNNRKDDFSLFTDEKKQEILAEIKAKFKQKEHKNFEVHSVLPAKKALWTLWSLPTFLKKSPVDILHVQYITPIWLPGNVKLVTTIHDVSFARHPEFIDKKDLFLLNNFIPLSLKRADKIIAVSEFTKKEIVDIYKIDADKIEVIYNGGAAEAFSLKSSKEEVAQFVKKRKLPEEFILYVGTLQPRKNIPFLLRNFVRFKEKFSDDEDIGKLKLVIGGNRAGHNYDKKIDLEMAEIEKRTPKIAKQIIFAGFIPDKDLPMYYKAAKILCLCSHYEGFGLPAIEAMASETPVLSTDASCMPEICADAAALYKHDDAGDFIKKLFKVTTDKDYKKALIEKGKKRTKSFNWKETARQVSGLYRQI